MENINFIIYSVTLIHITIIENYFEPLKLYFLVPTITNIKLGSNISNKMFSFSQRKTDRIL